MPATQKKSPGPADYTLKPLIGCPNHDVNSLFARGPCWTIPSRSKKSTANEISPSAATYKVGNLTRFGKPKDIRGVIGNRPANSRIVQPNPGPYNAVNLAYYKSGSSPKYTIGVKMNETKKQKLNVPLYDSIPLDFYKHRAPKFTMLGRRKETIKERRPGPMNYDAGSIYVKMIAKRAPAYTMQKRPKDSSRREKLPGPANYDLMNYNPFANAPKYTHATKHSQLEHVFTLPQDNC